MVTKLTFAAVAFLAAANCASAGDYPTVPTCSEGFRPPNCASPRATADSAPATAGEAAGGRSPATTDNVIVVGASATTDESCSTNDETIHNDNKEVRSEGENLPHDANTVDSASDTDNKATSTDDKATSTDDKPCPPRHEAIHNAVKEVCSKQEKEAHDEITKIFSKTKDLLISALGADKEISLEKLNEDLADLIAKNEQPASCLLEQNPPEECHADDIECALEHCSLEQCPVIKDFIGCALKRHAVEQCTEQPHDLPGEPAEDDTLKAFRKLACEYVTQKSDDDSDCETDVKLLEPCKEKNCGPIHDVLHKLLDSVKSDHDTETGKFTTTYMEQQGRKYFGELIDEMRKAIKKIDEDRKSDEQAKENAEDGAKSKTDEDQNSHEHAKTNTDEDKKSENSGEQSKENADERKKSKVGEDQNSGEQPKSKTGKVKKSKNPDDEPKTAAEVPEIDAVESPKDRIISSDATDASVVDAGKPSAADSETPAAEAKAPATPVSEEKSAVADSSKDAAKSETATEDAADVDDAAASLTPASVGFAATALIAAAALF